ncbi:MAG: hypothetical protein ACTHNP_02105 [Solirubrobacterales bacterium]
MKNRVALGAACALAVVALIGAVAAANQVGSEGQVASFEAKLSPSSLPRSRTVPVQLRVEGEFLATPENHLAQLLSLEIGVNRHGKLITKGFPICRRRQLDATTTRQALRACASALIGHGRIRATTAFPEQKREHYRAVILAFNGKRKGGGTEIFLHIHGNAPGPFTVVIPVKVRRNNGTFGTTFFAEMPPFARRWAYLTKFRFVIGRRYMVNDKRLSVLRASCPAPKGLNGGIFPFARATYRFLTTKTLRTTLVGSCHVKKE